MTNLIDTHFHLDHYRNYHEIASAISALSQYTICVTNSPGVFLSCKNMIPETKYLKFAIGFHPLEIGLSNADMRDFVHLLSRTNYVGEIGLDFSKSAQNSQEDQLRFFEMIMERCSSENKLMTVHIRRAEAQAIDVIRRHSPRRCIIHWFSGNEKQMTELLDLGCYMSINSNMVTSKNNAKYLNIPRDRLLIESDGPYTKVSGKKFVPQLLRQSYSQIAEFYNLPDLATIVYTNFRSLLEM